MKTKKPIKYLVVGGWNTVFGYFSTIGFYKLFAAYLHIILIATMTNILTISMSFATYKLLVFQTEGNWWKEYARSYVVYGLAAIISIMGLWVLVDVFHVDIWISQGLVMIIVVIMSYFGHDRYTFKAPLPAVQTKDE